MLSFHADKQQMTVSNLIASLPPITLIFLCLLREIDLPVFLKCAKGFKLGCKLLLICKQNNTFLQQIVI